MATMTETSETTDTQKRFHQFHAEAHVLSGELQRPIQQKIEPHVPVALKDERGGHLIRFTEDVSIEGLITFKSGHSRVSGSRSLKHHGWVTLSTAILEGLNVFEIITADRLVAQVSTEHPYENGHVPHVTFLGTKFENLRIGGFPLKLTLHLAVCGKKPEGDKSYLEDPKFLSGVREQAASIAHAEFLPEKVKDEYDKRLTEIDRLNHRNGGRKGHDEHIKVTCSLVKSIDIDEIPIPGLRTVGNVLFIPDFGAVSLAEVEVGIEPPGDSASKQGRHGREASASSNNGKRQPSNYFALKMLNMELGCVGTGNVTAASTKSNGNTYP
jgi:hypothetical protein